MPVNGTSAAVRLTLKRRCDKTLGPHRAADADPVLAPAHDPRTFRLSSVVRPRGAAERTWKSIRRAYGADGFTKLSNQGFTWSVADTYDARWSARSPAEKNSTCVLPSNRLKSATIRDTAGGIASSASPP